MAIEPPPPAEIARAVSLALAEDRAADDITSLNTVPAELQGRGVFVARDSGVVAGLALAAETFRQLDPNVHLSVHVEDGARIAAGETIAVARGPVRALLQGERVALNFLQRLSGVATLTRQFVDEVSGTGVMVLDTRKTTPGLRDLEKYAVRCGGGTNHRRDLVSMAMIKDNHREALAREGRTLAEAAAAIRSAAPGRAIEIEIDAPGQLEDALAARPEWVLLDNMGPGEMREAARLTAGRAKLEASGGVTLATIAAIAATGVDAISVGALTHSAPALDISLELSF
ncbi:MAG: carboxylating nicotinate-nucleotide diphosphorylase [Dehalococcoidia bacterium]|nr:carboxylating nicotinate-nucleotide diphosphorylase [Dehalococcoidia bacterium]